MRQKGNEEHMGRLLLIACSQRKDPAEGVLPALARYDGPAFRVLRKYLREAEGTEPVVLILSAKYGLIAANRKIPAYDCRMSARSARALRPRVLDAARRVLASQRWRAIGICAGKEYQVALEGLSELIPEGARVDLIRGGQGPRLTALRNWLHQES
jgi:hypothetical protein